MITAYFKKLLDKLTKKNSSLEKGGDSNKVGDSLSSFRSTPFIDKEIAIQEDNPINIINSLLYINQEISYTHLPRIAYLLQQIHKPNDQIQGDDSSSVLVIFNKLRTCLEQSVYVEEYKLFPIFYRWSVIQQKEYNVCEALNTTLYSRKKYLHYLENIIDLLKLKHQEKNNKELHSIINRLEEIQHHCMYKEYQALPLLVNNALQEMRDEYYQDDAYQQLQKRYSSTNLSDDRKFG